MLEAVEHKIKIEVKTKFLPEQSEPEEAKFAFCYTITIYNQGEFPTKLVSRRWKITNSEGDEKVVEGLGVVGEQPYLNPGESFRYTSGAILDTPVGAMEGSYKMLSDDGESFDALIPAFRLAVPEMVH